MIAKTLQVVLSLSLVSLSFAQRRSEWKSASKEDRAIEFQWYRPVNNSCEVSFRDLQLKTKTSLTATIEYLPHKLPKSNSETETAHLVIGLSGAASEHIGSCEQVVTVSVNDVSRE